MFPPVWHDFVKILDKTTWGNPSNGPHLCYHSIVWGGDRRLYREAQLAYIFSDESNPTNHPIFSLDTDMGSSLLQLTNAPEPPLKIRKQLLLFMKIFPPIASIWNVFFDGASSREGVGVGVVFISPAQEAISVSYKIEFEATNNVAEYEALVLGFEGMQRTWGLKRYLCLEMLN
jgi:hypothetical protein